tara:strand:+ start:95 stop:253 length:159 start_codon:yes stop_codon:yes gene_type:complete
MNKTLLIVLIILALLIVCMFVIPALFVNKMGNDLKATFGEGADEDQDQDTRR